VPEMQWNVGAPGNTICCYSLLRSTTQQAALALVGVRRASGGTFVDVQDAVSLHGGT
jgi:hypothetical protein